MKEDQSLSKYQMEFSVTRTDKSSCPSKMADKKSVQLEKFVGKCAMDKRKKDAGYWLNKLDELISDDITNDNEAWICRLLENFLQDHGDNGYKVNDLPTVMKILEFLAWRARNVREYQIHLEKMLEICKLSPVLEKTGEILNCLPVFERYFTTLGYLIAILPNDKDVLTLFQAIDCLLVKNDPKAPKSAVKADFCLWAMERSRLPIIVAELVEISSEIMYRWVLELVFILAASSYTCCYRMLDAGILGQLFMRMDLNNAEEKLDKSLAQDRRRVLWKECIVATTNIVWALMRAILNSKEISSGLQKPCEPNTEATRSLRNVLRNQVIESSQGESKNVMLRNDLAVLILAGLVALPSWRLVNSGLAEDLILLSIATELGASGTWAENVNFQLNNGDDLFFKKIMLSILCQLCNRTEGAIITIMIEKRVVAAILELINSTMKKCCYLLEFAMRILGRLVPKMPGEFILNKGPSRLISILDQFTKTALEFNDHITMECTKSICEIVLHKCCNHVIDSFREAGIMDSLLELADRILLFDRLTMQHQRILTLLMVTVEEISKATERRSSTKSSHCLNIKMPTKFLKRCFYQRKNDFHLDQRLLIVIGSCIWHCILSNPENTEEFVENGGIYILLDVIENSILPVRSIYLGILADMCSTGFGVISQLCTWRGEDKSKGFISLLGKSWREEEIRSGVKRTPEGFIEDMELPIMGTEQWINAFHERSTYDFSPALASILGSVRPKIYALRKILKIEADRYKISKEHYKILLDDFQSEECTTMYIADQFYRFSQGQLWSEVSRYLEQQGVNLLGMDGEIIILMHDRHCGWAMYVRRLQDKFLRAQREKEAERERREITRMRNSKLGSSLKALEKIDFIRRPSDRDYEIKMKNLQRSQIKKSSQFSRNSDRQHCQSTFNNKLNVTTIFEATHTIPSVRTHLVDSKISEVLPVSPASSSSLKSLGSISEKRNRDSVN